MSNAATIERTSLGYRLFPGVTYRFTVVSGTTHVDEYVAACGVWVYYGSLVSQ